MPVKQGREGVRQEMHKFKHGELHSGSKTGPIVKNRKQAIAIALHEAGLSRKQEGGAIDVDSDSDDRQMAPWIRQYAERRGKDPNDLSEDEVRQLARERSRSIPWVQTMDRLYPPSDEGYQSGGFAPPQPPHLPITPQIKDRLQRALRDADSDESLRDVVNRAAAYGVDWGHLLKPGGNYARGGMGGLGNLGKLGSHLPLGMSTVGKFKMRMPKMGRMRGFQHMPTGGFVDSSVPGRTDKHYVTVPSGSYVLPADHVSALGQNNSIAGAHTVRRMFGPGTKFGPRLAMPRFAGGGAVEPVPIVVAGGEMILPPNIVRRIGGGDIDKGHDVLDRWVMDTRKKHVEKLKTLKPPKGSD